MSEWIDWSERKPETDRLVLVDLGSFSGYGLRMIRSNGELYTEEDFLDDSELEPVKWQPLPPR